MINSLKKLSGMKYKFWALINNKYRKNKKKKKTKIHYFQLIE